MPGERAARFKAILAALPADLKKQIDAELVKQAHALVDTMKRAAPKKSGALQSSIRAERVPGRELSIAIRAGGPLTTKPVRNGTDAEYDYALGTEHGNEQVPAQPFFYPSFRLRKPIIQRGVNKAVKAAITTAVKRG